MNTPVKIITLFSCIIFASACHNNINAQANAVLDSSRNKTIYEYLKQNPILSSSFLPLSNPLNFKYDKTNFTITPITYSDYYAAPTYIVPITFFDTTRRYNKQDTVIVMPTDKGYRIFKNHGDDSYTYIGYDKVHRKYFISNEWIDWANTIRVDQKTNKTDTIASGELLFKNNMSYAINVGAEGIGVDTPYCYFGLVDLNSGHTLWTINCLWFFVGDNNIKWLSDNEILFQVSIDNDSKYYKFSWK